MAVVNGVFTQWCVSLVAAVVLSWLDYGNAALDGLPASLTWQLGRWSSSLRAYYRCSRWLPLATSSRAHQAETGSHHSPRCSWCCTMVFIGSVAIRH